MVGVMLAWYGRDALRRVRIGLNLTLVGTFRRGRDRARPSLVWQRFRNYLTFVRLNRTEPQYIALLRIRFNLWYYTHHTPKEAY